MADKNFGAYAVDGVNVVSNILDVFSTVQNSLDISEYNNALLWYPLAHAFAQDLASAYNLTVSQACGIIAALSPQLSWNKNKTQALEFCKRMRNGESLVGLMAYKANVNKAFRIYNGENSLDVLGGMKVRSFYANLMLDDNAVTVDRHATHIALFGTSKPDEKSGSIAVTDKLYKLISSAYVDAAKLLNVPAYVVQSVTWTFKAQSGGSVL
jgi:hypothetical protein